MFTPFENEPYVDFSQDGPAQAMLSALRTVETRLGRDYPLVIGGERISTDDRIVSTNPAQPDQVVGSVSRATPKHAGLAVQRAWEQFPRWAATPPEERARCLVKAAAIMRRRIYEFSAWMVFEVSKSWAEAYADTAEAIDFLEFYAREMLRLGYGHQTTPYPGEENEVRYIPIGVVAVLAPWNFPLAIFSGMTAAAAVTGNTVVAKPAEQSPVVAALACDVLEEAGVPPGVVNFLPGHGEDAGEALTGHPLVRAVAFTGSREVGLHVYQRAATHVPGQKWLKRAILEMGGKNAIVVDEGVDVDVAAAAVVASAFGFQGQKCSACSRVIAHKALYEPLVARIAELTSRLVVGNPAHPATNMGAVIEADAQNRIERYVEIGRRTARPVITPSPRADTERGWFVDPAIFADVDPMGQIAQEEIFGPVLAAIPAGSFDESISIANCTEFGLTGGCFSPVRAHLELARRSFHVGNLYLNRKCTGALVDVQPFGGFNMSGTDSKAGGRDYLQLFMQPKAIAERF